MTGLLYLFFFLSGFCALIYQVAWVRILSLDLGSTVYAISTVLTIFMGGLALGSYLFGRWIDRGPHPLRVYGSIELAVGAYAVLFVLTTPYVHQLSNRLLEDSVMPQNSLSLLKFLIALIVLLTPATLMGGTLPVLAKLVSRSRRTLGRNLGALYGFNTLGAVIGCLAEAYVLILTLGVRGSLFLAAGINGALGIASFMLSRYARAAQPEASAPAPDETAGRQGAPEPDPAAPRLALLHAVAFSSGFITLATEVLWTRLLTNFLTSNVLIFATVLGAFLSGITIGSFCVARWVDRLRRLDRALGILLLASGLWLAASVLGQGLAGGLFDYVHDNYSRRAAVHICLGMLFLVVTVPAAVFGAVFPLLFRWSSRSLVTVGYDVGRLYASNTVGAIAGSFVSGFVLIGLLGVNSSLLLLAACYGLLCLVVSRNAGLKLASAAAGAACVVLAALPGVRQPVYWYNGGFNHVVRVPERQTIYLKEGIEATVGVAWKYDVRLSDTRLRDERLLTVNGVIVAESSPSDLWDLLLKAHLPMLLHENPRRVAVVGLGAGVTLGAVEAYDVERIDCIEISPEVVPAHEFFADFNGRCWEDPRLYLWINDGRHFLQTTTHRYDVISVDPTDPPMCTLYTQDFFQLCHDRLDAGGLMVEWVPLFHLSGDHIKVIVRAFLNVFGETTAWYDGTSLLLIGKRGGPLEVNVGRFIERYARPEVQKNTELIGNPDPWLLLSTYVAGPEKLDGLIGPDVEENTDDVPYLEYAVLLSDRVDGRTMTRNLRMIAEIYEPDDTLLRRSDRTAPILENLGPRRYLMRDLLGVRILGRSGRIEEANDAKKRLIEKYKLTERHMALLTPLLYN